MTEPCIRALVLSFARVRAAGGRAEFEAGEAVAFVLSRRPGVRRRSVVSELCWRSAEGRELERVGHGRYRLCRLAGSGRE